MSKPWKCRLGWHAFVRRPGNVGPNQKQCRNCGKQTDTNWFFGG